ncbi:tripartite tricarboxylate transporter substrate binding protein [uncultured Ramlibacter sp.]|uniref:Bug family tripartite tricarboxylate transporter substrate binding protein n=1 Tax=uncultured Ramlibacter sp. TaxID=260755 RepID=UPI00261490A0|nr:tripartite tricarboxylate transporter substrate binding protein [uncultured Ramlibacter sp.]
MKLTHALAATAVALWGSCAWAQAYPNKPIRLIVGYSPAGAGDTIARIVGDAMSKQLGQTIVIDNKAGAGSTLASNLLSQAPADGYTLGLATGTLYGIDQHLYKVKYTPASFTPITRFTISPLILAVNKDLGVGSVKDLAARAKANPGKLNYSSSGIGGSPHMGGLSFEKAIGAKMTHIPYKGGAPALQAVVAGDVQLSFGTASSVLQLGQAGTVKMLGVTTVQRSAIAPELPTLAESGLPGFDFNFWFGLFGPANLPKDVQEKLFNVATQVLNDPAMRARLLGTGNESAPSKSPAEFHEWASANGKAVLERAEAAGVKVE